MRIADDNDNNGQCWKCLKLQWQEQHDCEGRNQGERGSRSATEVNVDDGGDGGDDDDDGDDGDDGDGGASLFCIQLV